MPDSLKKFKDRALAKPDVKEAYEGLDEEFAFLEEVLKRNGSDLHFMAGGPPRIRQYGRLMNLREEKLAPEHVREALYEIMPRAAIERFESRDGCDFAYNLGSLARFRVNALRHLDGLGAVFRAIPSKAIRKAEPSSPRRCPPPPAPL